MYWLKKKAANTSDKMNNCQIQQKWNKDENHLAWQKLLILTPIKSSLDLNLLPISSILEIGFEILEKYCSIR